MEQQTILQNSTTSLMTYDDVAVYLNRSINTLRHDVQVRKIPHIKIGGSVRFKKGDIDSWLESKAVKARG